MAAPGMPAGSKLHLKKWIGKGTGHVRIEPAKMLPRVATINLSENATMLIESGTQQQDMTMAFDIGLVVSAP